VIDTGYGPRAFLKYAAPSLGRFTNRLAGGLTPTGTSTTQMETPRLRKIKRRWWAMRTAGRSCLKINSFPRSNGACEARRARHGPV